MSAIIKRALFLLKNIQNKLYNMLVFTFLGSVITFCKILDINQRLNMIGVNMIIVINRNTIGQLTVTVVKTRKTSNRIQLSNKMFSQVMFFMIN